MYIIEWYKNRLNTITVKKRKIKLLLFLSLKIYFYKNRLNRIRTKIKNRKLFRLYKKWIKYSNNKEKNGKIKLFRT